MQYLLSEGIDLTGGEWDRFLENVCVKMGVIFLEMILFMKGLAVRVLGTKLAPNCLQWPSLACKML